MFLSAVLAVAGFISQVDIPAKYFQAAPKPDAVVAKVDGVEIKAKDVSDLLWQWRSQEAIADLVSYQVIKNAAQKEQVSASDAEVQKAVDQQLVQIAPQVPAGKTVELFLLEQGFTPSRLWLRLKTEILLNKIAAKDFKPAEYVKVSTIVVRPENTSTKALTDAAKKADLFYEKLTKGEDWQAVLNLSTTDLRTLESKGLVGWRRVDAFPQVVQDEFKTLKMGGVAKPSQTNNGIQILRLEAHGKDAKGTDLEEAEAIHVASNKSAVAQRIRAAAKIEKFPQNSVDSNS